MAVLFAVGVRFDSDFTVDPSATSSHVASTSSNIRNVDVAAAYMTQRYTYRQEDHGFAPSFFRCGVNIEWDEAGYSNDHPVVEGEGTLLRSVELEWIAHDKAHTVRRAKHGATFDTTTIKDFTRNQTVAVEVLAPAFFQQGRLFAFLSEVSAAIL